MLIERLTSIQKKVSCIKCFLIGNHRVDHTCSADFNSIKFGLTVWFGCLLDHISYLRLSPQEDSREKGRVMTHTVLSCSEEVDLTPLLSSLDALDEVLLQNCSKSFPFKEESTFHEKDLVSSGIRSLIRVTMTHCNTHEDGGLTIIRSLHQCLCFLKKLDIDRPDLMDELIQFNLKQETILAQSLSDFTEHGRGLIQLMNTLARRVLSDFKMDSFLPRHGPGVVADKGVKTHLQKYLSMESDPRIDYLLRSRGFGRIEDYNPLYNPVKQTLRTSRFIGVPKSWKKLRGISAEPAVLQFFQQGVMHALDEFFKSSDFWNSKVRLHDQEYSREYAKYGSIHRGYSTIDLSAASDSVTLVLVKEVFKGTPVLPWLLGTRSTCTEFQTGDSIRLRKFAPMGSACCFPVECMIFCLLACVTSGLEQVDRWRKPTIIVFGDDIIIDSSFAPELIENLSSIGFSVNKQKSFIDGYFKESCGIECYHGMDIKPFRFTRIESGSPFHPNTRVNQTDIGSYIALINALYDHNYHDTRKYVLNMLLSKHVQIGASTFSVSRFLDFTWDGRDGTLYSSHPSNFNKRFRVSKDLQCKITERLVSVPRWNHQLTADEDLWFNVSYVEWLIRHSTDKDEVDDFRIVESGGINIHQIRLGVHDVPALRWVSSDYLK